MGFALRRAAKATLVYAMLVAPPVAGLLWILRAGEDLHPPRHIGGDWVVSFSGSGCGRLRADAPLALHVSQSGPRSIATFSDAAHTQIALRLDGNALAGEQDRSGCRLAVAATLSDPAGSLTGTMRWLGCGTCTAEPFVASRGPSR